MIVLALDLMAYFSVSYLVKGICTNTELDHIPSS